MEGQMVGKEIAGMNLATLPPPPTDKKFSDSEAMMENMRLMNTIIREMKEIPELPSEAPKEVNHLIKVEFPESGGVLTYMSGQEYPYKGFPYFEFVEKIDIIKKVSRAVMSSFFHSMKKRSAISLLPVVFAPWIIGDSLKAGIYTFYRVIERFRIKKNRYCDALREVHRAMSVDFHGETSEEKEFRHMVRDLVCMVLEFDNAYRYRFQDIIVELDKDALRKNPRKELMRLLDILQSREKQQEVKDTWTLFKKFLPYAFYLNRNISKNVVSTLTELDLSKVALSVEDKCFAKPRKDYTFGFQHVS